MVLAIPLVDPVELRMSRPHTSIMEQFILDVRWSRERGLVEGEVRPGIEQGKLQQSDRVDKCWQVSCKEDNVAFISYKGFSTGLSYLTGFKLFREFYSSSDKSLICNFLTGGQSRFIGEIASSVRGISEAGLVLNVPSGELHLL